MFREQFEALSDERKADIMNESKMYNFRCQEDVNSFWATRDLRENAVILNPLNETKVKSNEQSNTVDDYYAEAMKNFASRMKRF